MINRTVLVGRLTRDPELRKTGTGKSVVNFTIACNRQFGNKEEADFINCIAWNNTADFIGNYLSKGALVGLEGRIQTGSYEDRDTGKVIYTTDVIVDNLQALESKRQREQSMQSTSADTVSQSNYQNVNNKTEEEPTLEITSDDLPF